MSADATRLLVLGATRQEQPATGYAIMRELISWGVQEWASVNPGSIYGALRALVKDGLVVEDSSPSATTGRSHKTSLKFRLTTEGGLEFEALLRLALQEASTYRVESYMAALCFLVELPRDEVVSAIEGRTIALENALKALRADELLIPDSDTKPLHSIEFVKLAAARLEGELAFTHALSERIRSGVYVFRGEPSE